ncbi:efflux RND transporter periplasmic adaptor subunit [Coleofasciculus sp. F4-SAH-05]|uniref:efflux RND transporter periplasmic adaptor subunit n=1 Tax=Coleofasciculus sp. F4-SAH-05 TaxID=3069525 RepID=UPI0040648CAA
MNSSPTVKPAEIKQDVDVVFYLPDAEADTYEQDAGSSPQSGTENAKKGWLSGGKGLFLGIGIGVLLALGATRLVSSQQSDAPTAEPPVATSSAPSQSVTVAQVISESVSRSLDATGSSAAFEMNPVMSQATGLQIQQVLVEEGQVVKAGQLLARLDNSVLQAQLNQAQASVAQAEARLAELRAGSRSEEIARAKEVVSSAESAVAAAESDLELAITRVDRNKKLQAEGAIARDRLDEVYNQERSSRSQLEQAQARLREAKQQLAQLQAGPRREVITQAEAQLAQAQAQVQSTIAQLNNTRILAPVSGKIAERNARVGNVTSGSQTLFKIIENGRLELIANVPETQLPQIQPGQSVTITSDADSSLQLSGKVREIDPMIDEASRQAQVKIDLPASATLKPGMFLRASITTSAAQGLTLPAKAILPQSDGSAIAYIVQPDNTVKAQPVEVGELLGDNRVEIKSGLSVGDRVVVKGAAYLKDGDTVEVVN